MTHVLGYLAIDQHEDNLKKGTTCFWLSKPQNGYIFPLPPKAQVRSFTFSIISLYCKKFKNALTVMLTIVIKKSSQKLKH